MAFKRVATEGITTDGRVITRTQIEQMAKNYDPKKYGARLWMEHFRGVTADGIFPALGDVVAVKAEKVEDGKLALFADIVPTEEMRRINAKRQKVYSSIEMDPDFAASGEAYLVGLGVTDSPASLGTEFLTFSQQQGDASPLMARKQRKENLFTAGVEMDVADLFAAPAPKPDEDKSLLKEILALFKKQEPAAQPTAKAEMQNFAAELQPVQQAITTLATTVQGMPSADAFAALKRDHETLQTKFNELHAQLSKESDRPPRTPAAGGNSAAQTDC